MGAGDIRAGGAYVELNAETAGFERGMNSVSSMLSLMGSAVQRTGAVVAAAGAALSTPLIMAQRHFFSVADDIGRKRVEAVFHIDFEHQQGKYAEIKRSLEKLGAVADKGLVKAAEHIRDATRIAGESIRILGAEVGAALGPAIKAWSVWVVGLSRALQRFIRENQPIVQLFSQIAVGLVPVGIALTAAVAAVSLLSGAIGSLSSAFTALPIFHMSAGTIALIAAFTHLGAVVIESLWPGTIDLGAAWKSLTDHIAAGGNVVTFIAGKLSDLVTWLRAVVVENSFVIKTAMMIGAALIVASVGFRAVTRASMVMVNLLFQMRIAALAFITAVRALWHVILTPLMLLADAARIFLAVLTPIIFVAQVMASVLITGLKMVALAFQIVTLAAIFFATTFKMVVWSAKIFAHAVKKVFKYLWDGLVDASQLLWKLTGKAMTALSDMMINTASRLWGNLLALSHVFVGAISTVFQVAMAVGAAIATAVAGLIAAIPLVLSVALLALVVVAGGAIFTFVSWVVSTAITLATTVGNAISIAWQAVAEFFAKLGQSIADNFRGGKSAAATFFGSILESLGKVGRGIYDFFKGIIDAIFGAFTAVETKLDSMKGDKIGKAPTRPPEREHEGEPKDDGGLAELERKFRKGHATLAKMRAEGIELFDKRFQRVNKELWGVSDAFEKALMRTGRTWKEANSIMVEIEREAKAVDKDVKHMGAATFPELAMAVAAVGHATEETGDKSKKMIDKSTDAMTAATEKATEKFKVLGDAASEAIDTSFGSILRFFQAGKWREGFNALGAKIKLTWLDLTTNIHNAWLDLYPKVLHVIGDLAAGIQSMITSVVNAIKPIFEQVLAVYNKIANSRIAQQIFKGQDKIKSAVTEIAQKQNELASLQKIDPMNHEGIKAYNKEIDELKKKLEEMAKVNAFGVTVSDESAERRLKKMEEGVKTTRKELLKPKPKEKEKDDEITVMANIAEGARKLADRAAKNKDRAIAANNEALENARKTAAKIDEEASFLDSFSFTKMFGGFSDMFGFEMPDFREMLDLGDVEKEMDAALAGLSDARENKKMSDVAAAGSFSAFAAAEGMFASRSPVVKEIVKHRKETVKLRKEVEKKKVWGIFD